MSRPLSAQQQQEQQTPPGPFWWFKVAREQFTKTCHDQYDDHMAGSHWDQVLPSARFSFDTEVVYSKPRGNR